MTIHSDNIDRYPVQLQQCRQFRALDAHVERLRFGSLRNEVRRHWKRQCTAVTAKVPHTRMCGHHRHHRGVRVSACIDSLSDCERTFVSESFIATHATIVHQALFSTVNHTVTIDSCYNNFSQLGVGSYRLDVHVIVHQVSCSCPGRQSQRVRCVKQPHQILLSISVGRQQ